MSTLLLLLQEAAHGGGEAEHFTPFSINTGMAFWTVLIFLILVGLLWKMGWPAILKSVEEREQRIQRQLDEAEKGRAEAARLLEEQKAAAGGGAGGRAGDRGPCQVAGCEGAGSVARQDPRRAG